MKFNLSELAISSGVARKTEGPPARTPLLLAFRLTSEQNNNKKGLYPKEWGPRMRDPYCPPLSALLVMRGNSTPASVSGTGAKSDVGENRTSKFS